MLSEITLNTKTQADLFAEAEQAEESKLMAVVDRANQWFGRRVVRISSQDAGMEGECGRSVSPLATRQAGANFLLRDKFIFQNEI